MARARDRDLTGVRYGTLVALADTGEVQGRSRVWLWRCDCGVEEPLTTKTARAGQDRTATCRHVPRGAQLRHDIAGDRFGALVALYDVGRSAIGGREWRWRCDCGREEAIPLKCITGKSHGWRACSHCRAARCVVCDTPILHPTGRSQATCSNACRADRARIVARESAARLRADPRRAAAKRAYAQAHKNARPELYQGYSARSRARLAAERAADPDRRAAAAEAQRQYDQQRARRRALAQLMQEGATMEDRDDD